MYFTALHDHSIVLSTVFIKRQYNILKYVNCFRQTLPQIDRSVVYNIDHLVLTCEELLQKEQHAWRSTSQAARMMKKASGNEDDNSSSDNQ